MIGMNYEDQLRDVEEVLNEFPIDARKIYNTNKETLVIEQDSNLNFRGQYDIIQNRITIKDPSALKHELFHMASDNRKKFGTEFIPDFCLGGGVSYYRSNGTGSLYGKGFTEGFVQSLADMANMPTRGYLFETYIINLLVSIYGRDLYCFPLKNDPVGFYGYCSENIPHLREDLDVYGFSVDCYGEAWGKGSNSSELNDKLEKISLFMKLSIQDMITEYNICAYQPQITRRGFKEQMEQIFDDTFFWEYYELLPIKDKVSQEVIRMIRTDLVSTKYIMQEKTQKIKKFLHFSKY